jgi:hypothetical protein
MKTERVTMLTTPEFKAFLFREARKEKVSVAEFVRRRCERRTGDPDEAALKALTTELRAALGRAQSAVDRGLAAVEGTLTELRTRRAPRKRRS